LGNPQVASPAESAEITRLLKAWGRGDSAALDRLTPIVYERLHRMARGYMRGERAGHTLQPTALVNEAYLRLVDQRAPWHNRAQFFGVASRMMRRILIDRARAGWANDRGNGRASRWTTRSP
jgi:RNA polymerase sigma factor (TIGR02999 family)